MRQFAKEVKKNLKDKKLGLHCCQMGQKRAEDLVEEEMPNYYDNAEETFGSCDDYSYAQHYQLASSAFHSPSSSSKQHHINPTTNSS